MLYTFKQLECKNIRCGVHSKTLNRVYIREKLVVFSEALVHAQTPGSHHRECTLHLSGIAESKMVLLQSIPHASV